MGHVQKVTAIIKPSQLEEVKSALCAWGVTGLTVSEVKGFGRQHGHGAHYRGAEYAIEFVPKLQIEVVVPTPLVPRLVDVVMRAARTARIGDGKVFVTPVDEAVRIRTGERGEGVL
jgi:nitrogen regulatory protein P-II 1